MTTETVKFPGEVKLAGETFSHELPEVTDAFTVVEPGDVVTLKVWDAGVAPPTV